MSYVDAILRQIDAPPLPDRTGICAATIVADVDALATEWSRGNALSMIGDAEAAQPTAAGRIDQDVRGFEVPVQQAGQVGFFKLRVFHALGQFARRPCEGARVLG